MSTRRDPDAFFGAAHRILGEGGRSGVTIAALCDRLDVSKGSFYHHFEDIGSFVDRFALAWGAWLEQLFVQLGDHPDPDRRLEFAANEAFVVVSPAVRAMCDWANTNRSIAQAFLAAERKWWQVAAQTYAEAAEDEDSGQIITTINNAISWGFLTRPRYVERERYVQLLAVVFSSYGVETDLRRPGGRARLEVVSWDRPRTRRLDDEPLSADEVPATSAASAEKTELRRGNAKDAYFAAATQLLGELGADALTITALTERLGVTAGSFQHHFGSRSRFVQEFAAHRTRQETARLRTTSGEGNPWRRLEMLLSQLLADPDPVEIAWRSWGHSDPVVGAAIRRVDAVRAAALAETVDRISPGRDAGAVAELTLDLALGLRRADPPFGPALRTRAATEWMRRVVGVDAQVLTHDGTPRLRLAPLR